MRAAATLATCAPRAFGTEDDLELHLDDFIGDAETFDAWCVRARRRRGREQTVAEKIPSTDRGDGTDGRRELIRARAGVNLWISALLRAKMCLNSTLMTL